MTLLYSMSLSPIIKSSSYFFTLLDFSEVSSYVIKVEEFLFKQRRIMFWREEFLTIFM